MTTDERLVYLARLKVLSEKTTAWLQGGDLDMIHVPGLTERARRKLEKQVLSRAWQAMAEELRALTRAHNQQSEARTEP